MGSGSCVRYMAVLISWGATQPSAPNGLHVVEVPPDVFAFAAEVRR